MILTKINLDRRHPAIRQSMRNCQDMHRSIQKLYGGDRQSAGVLYRLNITERDSNAYILSEAMPVETSPGMSVVATRDIAPLTDSFTAGQTWRFDLVAQPCKKVASEGQKNSRRVLLRTPEERLQWLEKKGQAHGFRVLWARESGQTNVYGEHKTENGGKMVMTAVDFCGSLLVEDESAFRKAYCEGIGPGKAYGMGMLLLARE